MQSIAKSKVAKLLVLMLVLLTVFALGGCKGSDGSAGATGPQGPQGPQGSQGPQGPSGATTVNISTLNADEMASFNMTGVITSVTMTTKPVVNFTVTDANGRGVVGLGTLAAGSTTNLAFVQVAVAHLSTDPTDTVTNAWSNYYMSGNAPTTEKLAAGLVDNGDGSYVYTFQNPVAGTIDMAATHRIVVQISGNVPNVTPTLPISNPVNIVKTFVPNGSPVTNTRDIVSETACNGCHSKIGDTRLDFSGNRFSTPGHGGRVTTQYCVLCHTSQNFSNPSLGVSTVDNTETLSNPTYTDRGVVKHSTWMISNGTNTYNELEFVTMIHKTHMGEKLTFQNYSINADHYFPNNIAYPQDQRNCTTCHVGPDADNWETKPSMKACGTCHDSISWAAAIPTGFVQHASTLAKTGSGSGTDGYTIADDSQCLLCHGATGVAPIAQYHQSDYATTHNPGLTGAANFKYVISSVTISAINATQGIPTIVFQILKNGTPVNLATDFTGTNLTGFTEGPGYPGPGGPSLMVVYAAPEDGITAPSDWNSGHTAIKLSNLIDGTKGTITGTTTMTAVLTTDLIPMNATMVTGAVDGAFIDQNWSSISSDPTGSVRPGIAAIQTATGYTPRRVIFSETKCDTCHEQLGTQPNFHFGVYNIAMCAMCHTPNQASSGWSASFRVWVHGIHGASKRTVPFTWHAASPTDGFYNLEYPAILNNCEQCHLPGTYDFSASQYTGSLINNMLNVLDASGTLASSSTSSYQFSPYVQLDTNYGANYSVASDGTYTNAAGTTLVSSPITATCSACHDSSGAIAHMTSSGGAFYAPRSSARTAKDEPCLICHGKGAVMDINVVHQY